MSNITRRPIYQKDAKPVKARKRAGKDAPYLEKVAQLPCVICHEHHMPQMSPTQVHHCIHGRGSMGKKSPDCMTIPLCEGHHQGNFDTSKIAIHREPQAWKEAYGLDTEWISWVEENLPVRSHLKIRGKCRASGCEERGDRAGFCSPHYHRNWSHGDPNAGGTSPGSVQRWLEQHKDHIGDDCLLWPFSKNEGYFSVKLPSGGWTKAHRRMCELAHGKAQAGMNALHSCHNKSCVNPRHLRWGTQMENIHDAIEAGAMPFGEKRRTSKLTVSDVRAIKRRLATGNETNEDIAKDYPVCRAAIWQIAAGKSWRHVK